MIKYFCKDTSHKEFDDKEIIVYNLTNLDVPEDTVAIVEVEVDVDENARHDGTSGLSCEKYRVVEVYDINSHFFVATIFNKLKMSAMLNIYPKLTKANKLVAMHYLNERNLTKDKAALIEVEKDEETLMYIKNLFVFEGRSTEDLDIENELWNRIISRTSIQDRSVNLVELYSEKNKLLLPSEDLQNILLNATKIIDTTSGISLKLFSSMDYLSSVNFILSGLNLYPTSLIEDMYRKYENSIDTDYRKLEFIQSVFYTMLRVKMSENNESIDNLKNINTNYQFKLDNLFKTNKYKDGNSDVTETNLFN